MAYNCFRRFLFQWKLFIYFPCRMVALTGKEEERQMFQQMQAMAQKQVFRKTVFHVYFSTILYYCARQRMK